MRCDHCIGREVHLDSGGTRFLHDGMCPLVAPLATPYKPPIPGMVMVQPGFWIDCRWAATIAVAKDEGGLFGGLPLEGKPWVAGLTFSRLGEPDVSTRAFATEAEAHAEAARIAGVINAGVV